MTMTDLTPPTPEPMAHCAICGRKLSYVPDPVGRWFHALGSRPRLAAREEDADYAIAHDCEPSDGTFDDCIACQRTLRDRRQAATAAVVRALDEIVLAADGETVDELALGDHFAGMPGRER